MALTFFVLSTFFSISLGLSSVLTYFETKPEITIFLKDGLNQETISSLEKDLSAYLAVKEVRYISKDKALDIYRQQNKNNPLLLEMVTANILPASFEISASDPKIFSQISQDFSTRTTIVDEIIYQQDIINSLLSWTNIVRQTGLLTVSVLSLVSFIVILVIIGMKITNRKDEVRISRLLGASRFYVKKPFLLEGLFYGFFGALLGWVGSFALFYYFQPNLNNFFYPITFFNSSLPIYYYALVAQIAIGTGVGYIASWVGVKRYIKY
jgi:cell division transport system permease protein